MAVQASGVLAGCKLHTYQAGSAINQATYQDLAGAVPNANPIVLDTNGGATIRYTPGVAYKLVLNDPTDTNTLASVDNYYGPLDPPTLASVLPSTLTQTMIGTVLYPQTAAEIAAGVTPSNYAYAPGVVDRYGTNTTPGTTNMLAAITAAFSQALQSGGANIQFLSNAAYFVGTISNAGSILANVTGLSNITIYGNGAQITCNTTVASGVGSPRIFDCWNWENVTIDNLWASDTGFDITQTWKGAQLFMFSMSDATDRKRVTIQNCRFKNLVTPVAFWTAGGGTGRYRGIKITGCVFDTCYNGPSFQEQGDEAEIDVTLINCLRNYFPYGCYGHNANLHVWHDGTSQGANAAIDIKRYANDTRDIRVRADFHGFVSQFGSLVNLETQMTAATAAITALGAITAGAGGTDATYYGVPLTGGTGTGATANITVKGAVVTAVQIVNRGKGYANTDSLGAATANIGNCTGFAVAVSAVGAVIDGIDIDLKLTDAQSSPGVAITNPIQFRSYTAGGVLNATTTDLWDRISIRGNYGQVALSPINIASVMTGVTGRISMESGLFDAAPTVPSAAPQDFPGFIVKLANNVERYDVVGSLIAAPLGIDMSSYAQRFFALIVDIEAESDYSSSSNLTAQSFIVIGNCGVTGAVSLGAATAIYAAQVSGGTSAAPAISSSGNKLTITFINYSGANARARVTVRHLARLR